MGYELNLTKEQQRRMARAKTPEEKANILTEAVRITHVEAELSENQLDAISGGAGTWKPQNKADAESMLSTIGSMISTYGEDVAKLWMEKNHIAKTNDTHNLKAHLSTLLDHWNSYLSTWGT